MSSLRLPNFFINKGYLLDIPNYSISSADLHSARSALLFDVNAFFINGLVSFASAINSINKNNYSWGFIQSYYSLFFFARAFNGINDYAIVYHNSKPFSIKIQPSAKFVKLKGNSHDVVLSEFKTQFASDILIVNQIEGENPVDWFNKKRNLINYTSNPFSDPMPPPDLYNYKSDLRKWMATYMNDRSHSYTFNPANCYIAYPLQVFMRLYNYYDDNNLKLSMIDEDKFLHLQKNLADDKGTLNIVMSRIKDILD